MKKPIIIQFPKIKDRRGNLSYLEEDTHVPFSIKRIYWIYDVPGGQVRGGHAFIKQQEIIIALSGSFDVIVDNGHTKSVFPLNQAYYGLYVPNKYWREMINFSTNSLALVISSTSYSEHDYIRQYDEFLKYMGL